jgi:hypothetical protein
MTDPSQASKPHTSGRSVGTVLAILIGAILLLPGVCAIGFMTQLTDADRRYLDDIIWIIWGASFAISIGGVLLIGFGIRRWRR